MLKDAQRPEPFFVSDHPALDFLSTLAAPWGHDIEWITNGEDLLDWLNKAELISSDVVKHFRDYPNLSELDAVAAQARELREWFRSFLANHVGKVLKSDALKELAKLNEILTKDRQHRKVIKGSNLNPLQLTTERDWDKPDDLLLPLAESMGDLVCTANFSRIKNCEGPTCTLYFLDNSKNGKRRWCSMSVCGNRAKAAKHRTRLKSDT